MPVITTRQRDLVVTAAALLGFTAALVLMLRHQDALARAFMLAPGYIMLPAIWMAPRQSPTQPRRTRILLVIAVFLGAVTAWTIAHIYNDTHELLTLYLIGGLVITIAQIVLRAIRSRRTP